jgi:hypothetical protein
MEGIVILPSCACQVLLRVSSTLCSAVPSRLVCCAHNFFFLTVRAHVLIAATKPLPPPLCTCLSSLNLGALWFTWKFSAQLDLLACEDRCWRNSIDVRIFSFLECTPVQCTLEFLTSCVRRIWILYISSFFFHIPSFKIRFSSCQYQINNIRTIVKYFHIVCILFLLRCFVLFDVSLNVVC